MAKPEWGTKRTCQSCGARFYDFGRTPAVCPACGAVFDVEVLARARRPRPSATRAVAAAPVIADEETEELADTEAEDQDDSTDRDDEEEDETVEAEEGGDEEDEGLIEDASELGEDDDMSDVIEGDVDEEQR